MYSTPATQSSDNGTQFRCVVTNSGGSVSSSAATLTVNPPVFTPIRVRAGGPAYTDSQGRAWSADYGYSGTGGTFTTTAAILGTADAPLYQTERWTWPGALQYDFAVPSGSYSVTLKFAENYADGAGQRVFNIMINGQSCAQNYDIFAQAGGKYRAVDQPCTVTANGAVSIQLMPVIGGPKVDAIEIVSR